MKKMGATSAVCTYMCSHIYSLYWICWCYGDKGDRIVLAQLIRMTIYIVKCDIKQDMTRPPSTQHPGGKWTRKHCRLLYMFFYFYFLFFINVVYVYFTTANSRECITFIYSLCVFDIEYFLIKYFFKLSTPWTYDRGSG